MLFLKDTDLEAKRAKLGRKIKLFLNSTWSSMATFTIMTASFLAQHKLGVDLLSDTFLGPIGSEISVIGAFSAYGAGIYSLVGYQNSVTKLKAFEESSRLSSVSARKALEGKQLGLTGPRALEGHSQIVAPFSWLENQLQEDKARSAVS